MSNKTIIFISSCCSFEPQHCISGFSATSFFVPCRAIKHRALWLDIAFIWYRVVTNNPNATDTTSGIIDYSSTLKPIYGNRYTCFCNHTVTIRQTTYIYSCECALTILLNFRCGSKNSGHLQEWPCYSFGTPITPKTE